MIDWYWFLILLALMTIVGYAWGYTNGTAKLELMFVQGDLIIDEFEGLPYLAMKDGGLDNLHDKDYVVLKVVRTKKDDSQKKQGL